MSEDRTTPMQQPQWSQGDAGSDEQETVFANHESVTPPTIPLGDSGPGFVRSVPSGGTTPPPYGPPPGPPGPQPPAVAADQTMIIAERKKPVFAWLVVVEARDANTIGTVNSLQPDTTTIGRVAGNHIIIGDDTCSSQHARIRIEAQEGQSPAYVLYDMGSSNGTYIGTRETYKDEDSRTYRHELQDGDYLLIGETTLVFKKL